MWLDADFAPRPIVLVEDHLYHTTDLLQHVARVRPDLVSAMTVCALARPGPDTVRTTRDWLLGHRDLQVATTVPVPDLALEPDVARRATTMAAGDFADAVSFARLVARLVRPGGLLVQDVQLTTLAFVPADRWWESIYLAAAVRGLFATRAPAVHFLSNKRGYAATFGRDLLDAGFDPRGVLDKNDLAGTVVPTLLQQFDRAFALVLDWSPSPGVRRLLPVSSDEDDVVEVFATLDLVLATGRETRLGGRLVSACGAPPVVLKQDGHEATSWRALVDDRLAGGSGVPVLEVGARVAPTDAARAELTNAAARHVHVLRGRLRDAPALVTRQHAYRLADDVSVGVIRPR